MKRGPNRNAEEASVQAEAAVSAERKGVEVAGADHTGTLPTANRAGDEGPFTTLITLRIRLGVPDTGVPGEGRLSAQDLQTTHACLLPSLSDQFATDERQQHILITDI